MTLALPIRSFPAPKGAPLRPLGALLPPPTGKPVDLLPVSTSIKAVDEIPTERTPEELSADVLASVSAERQLPFWVTGAVIPTAGALVAGLIWAGILALAQQNIGWLFLLPFAGVLTLMVAWATTETIRVLSPLARPTMNLVEHLVHRIRSRAAASMPTVEPIPARR